MDSLNLKTFFLFLFLASFTECLPQRSNEKKLGSYPDANIETFEEYKQVFNKQYVNAEHESQARKNFEETKKWLSENRDRSSHSLGFTSLSDGDMKFIPGFKLPDLSLKQTPKKLPLTGRSIPTKYDLENLMSKVTRQGDCGSCWAHAAASVIEANFAKHNKLSIVISREELIDCTITLSEDPTFNGQCHGGYPVDAWDYVKQRGIHTVEDYPMRSSYINHTVAVWDGTAVKNETIYDAIECQADKKTGQVYYIRDHEEHLGQSDAEIQQSIMEYGPALVAIEVPLDETYKKFKEYKGGVMENYNLYPGKPNHAVVIVGWGYDEHQKVNYWKVRNSHGDDWGEKGYFRLQRGINSMGINLFSAYLL